MTSHPTRTIAVVGGHGQIARLLLAELVRRGHTAIALVRREDYRAELEALGAQVRILDIENAGVDGFGAAFAGCDAVVFAAGGGADGNIERKRTVDLEGSTKSIEAAGRAGIQRFVQVSAIGVDAELPADTAPVWRAYVEAKRDADAALRASALDWTIIRPGRLTDDSATGRVRLDDDRAFGDVTGEIPRADVATVLAAVLEADNTFRVQAVLVAGDTPVTEAVSALTAG